MGKKLKKFKNRVVGRMGRGLAILGIWLYEIEPFGLLTLEQQKQLEELWDLHDKFDKKVKDNT